METIQGGKIEFDRCIATPDMMGTVGKIGKLLGPRGLMPNAKTGTVTFDIAKAVNDAKAGKVEYVPDFEGSPIPPAAPISQEEARAAFERMREEWRLLTAAALGGLARRAIEIAAAYEVPQGTDVRADVRSVIESFAEKGMLVG